MPPQSHPAPGLQRTSKGQCYSCEQEGLVKKERLQLTWLNYLQHQDPTTRGKATGKVSVLGSEGNLVPPNQWCSKHLRTDCAWGPTLTITPEEPPGDPWRGRKQQFHVKMMTLWKSRPIPTLEESANGFSVPVSDPIPLPPLNLAGRDFHTLHR